MKLHCVTWKEIGGTVATGDRIGRHWTASDSAASKFGTEKKKELRQSDGNPSSVERKVVEVDTKRDGLIEFLNKLADE